MAEQVRNIPMGDIRGTITQEEMQMKTNFQTAGIMSGITEGITRDGKPFVIGKLQDKETVFCFRMFDINIKHFEEKYEVTVAQSFAVSVLGYYCEHGLTVKKMCVLSAEEGMQFVNSAIFPTEDCFKIINSSVENIYTEELKILVDKILGFNEETIKYFPYSQEIHTEVGGYLQCITNLLHECSFKGLYTVEGDEYIPMVDMEVVKTAIICHNVGWLAFARADQFGIVTDNGEFAFSVYGSPAGVSLLMVYNLIREILAGKPTTPKAMNVVHCLGVLAGTSTPATLEAEMVKNLIEAEKSEYITSRLTQRLKQGEVVKNVGRHYIKL